MTRKTKDTTPMDDATDYLNSSRRNRELLEAAILEVKRGKGIHMTLEELGIPPQKIRAQYTLKETL